MENQSMDDLDLKTLEALYGEGVWEISKASQDEKRRRLNQAAAAGNAVSAVAGPAAVYSAIRHRAGGGVPRDVTSGIGGKLRQAKNPRLKKIGESAGRAVDYLNKPKSGRARLAAGVAGGTMIGLQVGNSAIDAVSAKLLNEPLRSQSRSRSARRPLTFCQSMTLLRSRPRPLARGSRRLVSSCASFPRRRSTRASMSISPFAVRSAR